MFEHVPGVWLLVGYLGQALFSARFLVQWIASEKRRQSVVPILFWWLSLGGGVTLLAYAIHRKDPVFVVGQLPGVGLGPIQIELAPAFLESQDVGKGVVLVGLRSFERKGIGALIGRDVLDQLLPHVDEQPPRVLGVPGETRGNRRSRGHD